MTKQSIIEVVINSPVMSGNYYIRRNIWEKQLTVGGSVKASQAGAAIYEIFSGDLAKIVAIVVAILLLIGGVCIAITIFRDLGNWDNTAMLILTVLWIVIAVVADVFSRSFGVNKLDGNAMFWILNVAKDLLIIGGLLSIR